MYKFNKRYTDYRNGGVRIYKNSSVYKIKTYDCRSYFIVTIYNITIFASRDDRYYVNYHCMQWDKNTNRFRKPIKIYNRDIERLELVPEGKTNKKYYYFKSDTFKG